MNNTYVLIIAGGSGTRFWPRSRDSRPKQLLSICGEETLIQKTIDRFVEFVPRGNIYIISKATQKEEIIKLNLEINPENILYEPSGKNTLPAIGLASLYIRKKDQDAVIIVSPADHFVENRLLFREAVFSANNIAKELNTIVTIGIKPTYPATGFGYICTGSEKVLPSGIKAFRVNKFTEKPDIKNAIKFCSEDNYYWNCGIFVFKYSVFQDEQKRYTPEIYTSLKKIEKHLDSSCLTEDVLKLYDEIEGISIDYAIIEKSDNVFMVKGGFVWNDLGSWQQVYEMTEKDEYNNASTGEVLMVDTENSYAYSEKGFIALLGVKDLFVIQDGNATLVCSREKGEEVKSLVEKIKDLGLNDYI